jgi:hypothetical protein
MLKAVLDTLDGLDDVRAGLYAQGDDGRYYLNAEGVDDLPAVRGLASTHRKFKEVAPDAKALKERLDRLAAFDGLDPDAAREALEKIQAAEEGKLKDKGEFEQLKGKIEERHRGELAKVQTEIQRRDGFISRLLIENAITAAIEKAGVLPQYREAVKALMYQRGPKVVADGDDYRAYFDTDMGEAAVGTYVETWARGDEAAAFLPPSGKSGGGANPTGGHGGGGRVNPWKAETLNLTEQGRIMREDPALAAQLKAAAGK